MSLQAGVCEIRNGDMRPGGDQCRSVKRRAHTDGVSAGRASGLHSVADLAAASGGTFHLLDLVPEPDPSDPDLAAFADDREGLKRTLQSTVPATLQDLVLLCVFAAIAKVLAHAAPRVGCDILHGCRHSG